MTTLLTTETIISADDEADRGPDEAQLAAAAFLARYSDRTLDAYRHDLRYFFQWAADQHLDVLAATRTHIEIYRSTTEQRGLAASTIDRRLSTVCGHYRFAHIDGRIPANPAQYVRRPKVEPGEQHAMDRGELGRFLFTAERYDRAHAVLAVLLASTGCGCQKRAPPTSKTSRSSAGIAPCGSSARARNPPSSASCCAPPARSISPSANATRVRSCDAAAGNDWTDAPPIGGYARSANEPGSATCIRTCCAPRSSWPPSAPASRYATSSSPPDMSTHAPP